MIEYTEYSYTALFFVSFLAATVVPFGSSPLLAYMVTQDFSVPLCLFVATCGNYLGGVSCYILGYLCKWKWLEKYFKVQKKDILKYQNFIQRWEAWAALSTWIPVVGDPITIALGFFRTKFIKVSIFMFTGKMLRYLVTILLTQYGMAEFFYGK